MTLIEMVNEYLEGKQTAIHVIRTLSGMFNPDHAVDILAIICAITRHEEGDLSTEVFKQVFLGDSND